MSNEEYDNLSTRTIKLTKKQSQLIEILYFNPNITSVQLSKYMESTMQATCNLIKRTLKMEPPLFQASKRKEISSNNFYSLTEEGKNYFETITPPEKIKQKESSNKVQITDDLEKYFISYIICNATKEKQNPLATYLIEMDIDLFLKEFTFQEFIFLAIQVGILSENSVNRENAYLFSNIKNELLNKMEREECQRKFFDFINDIYPNKKTGNERKLRVSELSLTTKGKIGIGKYKNKNRDWDFMITDLEKLTFKQAKQLYTSYISESDMETRKQLRTKIIQGTLHLVLNFIENNHFDLLHCSSYNMDDIISTAFEVWINKIDKGVLLKTEHPSHILNRTFYFDMEKILVNDEYDISNNLEVTQDIFIDLLSKFIQKRNQDNEFNYCSFVRWISESDEYKYLLNISNTMLEKEYILLDGIYKSFQKDEISITEGKIKSLFDLLVQNGLEHSKGSIYDVRVDSFADDVVTKEMYYDFLNVVFNQDDLTEREKIVLIRRFGIGNEEEQTLEQLGKKMKISGDRVRPIEANALRKLRRNKSVRSFRNLLD